MKIIEMKVEEELQKDFLEKFLEELLKEKCLGRTKTEMPGGTRGDDFMD